MLRFDPGPRGSQRVSREALSTAAVLLDEAEKQIQHLQRLGMPGNLHYDLPTLRKLKTALTAVNQLAALQKLRESDPTLKKLAVGMAAAEVPFKVALDTLESAFDIAARAAARRGNLEQALMAGGAREQVGKYLGTPLAVAGVVTSLVRLAAAIREGDRRGMVSAGTGAMSGSLALTLGGRAGGTAAALVQWYAQGLTIMGELGAILASRNRGAHVDLLKGLFEHAAALRRASMDYLQALDRLNTDLSRPVRLPREDAAMQRLGMEMAYRAARIAWLVERDFKATAGHPVAAVLRELALVEHQLPRQLEFVNSVRRELEWELRNQPVTFADGGERPGLFSISTATLAYRVANCIVAHDLIQMDVIKPDSAQARQLKRLYARP